MLIGMNVAAGPELAAAVTNAGGLGVIGGHGYTPKILRQQVCVLAKPSATVLDSVPIVRSAPSRRISKTRTHPSVWTSSFPRSVATRGRRT